MEIEGDSISFWANAVPKMNFRGSKIESSMNYTSNGFQINHEHFDSTNFEILSNDSIAVNFSPVSLTKTVYKRLEEPIEEIKWTPLNKSYEWTGNKSFIVNTKFMDNGIYIEYLRKSGQVLVGHWNTLKKRKHSFIILDALNLNTLSIDSITKQSVHVSASHERKYNYVLKEKHLSIPKNLLGEWFLVGTQNIEGIKPPPLPYSVETRKIEYLNITKDSIKTLKNNVESKRKWTLGGTGNLIIFPNPILKKDSINSDTLTRKEREIRSNILKIDSYSDTELIILSDYEVLGRNGFDIKLKFRRKKTTANNTYN
jgi:hypothetical protein